MRGEDRQDCVNMTLSNTAERTYLLVLYDKGSKAARQNERGEYPGDRVVEGNDGCLQDSH